MSLWRKVTGTYGLVVNEEKTGFQSKVAELNSRSFYYRVGFGPKPVISFFRPKREEPGDLWGEVISGIETFKKSTREWILNVGMRHELSLREIVVSSIPKRILKSLFRRSWFRRAFALGPAPIHTFSVKRAVRVSVGTPPRPAFYDFVTRASNDLSRASVDYWTGKEVCPFKQVIDRRAHKLATRFTPTPPLPFRYVRSPTFWQFVWPTALLRWCLKNQWDIFASREDCKNEWMDDHPFLMTACGLKRSSRLSRSGRALKGSFAPLSLPAGPWGYS